jgi:hypothetical protein
MRTLLSIVATTLIALGTVAVSGAPASAQTEGAEFCDLFGTLLGEEGQAECEAQGGNQIPLGDVTTPTCQAVDSLLTEVEDGGGGALAGPIRQVFTDGGICVFAQQESTTSTAPPTTQPPATTASPGPTLAITGSSTESGLPLALSGLLGLGLAGIALTLRRVTHRV